MADAGANQYTFHLEATSVCLLNVLVCTCVYMHVWMHKCMCICVCACVCVCINQLVVYIYNVSPYIKLRTTKHSEIYFNNKEM